MIPNAFVSPNIKLIKKKKKRRPAYFNQSKKSIKDLRIFLNLKIEKRPTCVTKSKS